MPSAGAQQKLASFGENMNAAEKAVGDAEKALAEAIGDKGAAEDTVAAKQGILADAKAKYDESAKKVDEITARKEKELSVI